MAHSSSRPRKSRPSTKQVKTESEILNECVRQRLRLIARLVKSQMKKFLVQKVVEKTMRQQVELVHDSTGEVVHEESWRQKPPVAIKKERDAERRVFDFLRPEAEVPLKRILAKQGKRAQDLKREISLRRQKRVRT